MPVYAWGAHNDYSSAFERTPAARLPLVQCFRHKVPLLEYGGSEIRGPSGQDMSLEQAPQSWTVQLHDSPVDRQLPWKSFAFPLIAFLGRKIAAGLTINGEIYFFSNEYYAITGVDELPEPPRDSPRFISRARSANVRGPFVYLSDAPYNDIFPNSFVCIDADGVVYQLFHIGDREPGRFVLFGTPPNVRAVSAAMVRSAALIKNGRDGVLLVVVADDGNTYLRGYSQGGDSSAFNADPTDALFSSDWIKVSDGIGSASLQMNGARFNKNAAKPTVVVPSPASGGRQASISIDWAEDESSWYPYRMRIDDPGDGYTETVQASLSRAPNSGGTPTVTLTPFTAKPLSVTHEGSFVCDDGKIVTFAIPRSKLYPGKESGQNVGGGYKGSLLYAEPVVSDETETVFGSASQSVSVKAAQSGYDINSFDTVWFVIDSAGALLKAVPTASSVTLVDSGPWHSVTSSGKAWAGIKMDGTLYTWGGDPHMLGDGSRTPRSTPTAICPDQRWVRVQGYAGGSIFYAVRKDDVCREFDQPMELWPNSYFQS